MPTDDSRDSSPYATENDELNPEEDWQDFHEKTPTITKMIKATMAKCPTAGMSEMFCFIVKAHSYHQPVLKFKITNPDIVEKTWRAHEKKATTATKKAANNKPKPQAVKNSGQKQKAAAQPDVEAEVSNGEIEHKKPKKSTSNARVLF